MSEYVWETFDTYRLLQADLKAFLAQKFGNHDFQISVRYNTSRNYSKAELERWCGQVEAGIYRFRVPRALSNVRHILTAVYCTTTDMCNSRKNRSLHLGALKNGSANREDSRANG